MHAKDGGFKFKLFDEKAVSITRFTQQSLVAGRAVALESRLQVNASTVILAR